MHSCHGLRSELIVLLICVIAKVALGYPVASFFNYYYYYIRLMAFIPG